MKLKSFYLLCTTVPSCPMVHLRRSTCSNIFMQVRWSLSFTALDDEFSTIHHRWGSLVFLYSSVRFNVATPASIATLSIVPTPRGQCLDEEVWSSRRRINWKIDGVKYIPMMFKNMTVYGDLRNYTSRMYRRLPRMVYHRHGATAISGVWHWRTVQVG